jgi:hypothetical protein
MGGASPQDSALIDSRSFYAASACTCKKFPASVRDTISPSSLSWLVAEETPMQIIDRRDPTEGLEILCPLMMGEEVTKCRCSHATEIKRYGNR